MTTMHSEAARQDSSSTAKRGTALSDETIAAAQHFHGHMCPGLALGLRAAEVALKEVGPHSSDEEVVALVETDMCAVDAIQFLTGCTFGKGNLIHLDHGKNAYTFIRRSDGRSVRVVTKADAFPTSPEQIQLFGRVRANVATEEEKGRFQEAHLARSQAILEASLGSLYDVREVRDAHIPPRARVMRSVMCAKCGEGTMETRLRVLEGRELCAPCFEAALSA